jgi:hypothetical protein
LTGFCSVGDRARFGNFAQQPQPPARAYSDLFILTGSSCYGHNRAGADKRCCAKSTLASATHSSSKYASLPTPRRLLTVSCLAAGHEEAEHLERLIVKDFRNELKGHKERLQQSHRVRNMLDIMQERAQKLVRQFTM